MLPRFNLFNVEIYSYPLFLGAALSLFIILANRSLSLKSFPKVYYLFFFFSSFIGAKLFFILTSEKFFLLEKKEFWLGGGYVFYGGLLFSLILALILVAQKKLNPEQIKFFITPLCFSHALGRIGCYFAGCCHGVDISGHEIPVQLLEAISLFLIALYQRKHPSVSYYLISYGIIRFLLEFLRGDTLRGVYGAMSFSQYVSLAIVFFAFIYKHKIKNRGSYG